MATQQQIGLGRDEVERGLINHLCMFPGQAPRLTLLDADISDEKNRLILGTIKEMALAGGWGFATLYSKLDCFCAERLNLITNGKYCDELVSVDEYESRLREMRLQTLAQSIVDASPDTDPMLISTVLAETATKILQARVPDRTIGDHSREAYIMIETAYNSGSGLTGISSGISRIDKQNSGFHPGSVTILAARPSIGKTSFAIQLAYNFLSAGKSVYIQSLEETSPDLVRRIWALDTKIDIEKIRSGQLSSSEWALIAESLESTSKLPLRINDKSGLTSADVYRDVSIAHGRKPIDVLIVDHLQEFRDQGRTRHDEISKAAGMMKTIAKTLKIPVIVLSQLSRAAEANKDSIPMLSHLKESGDIEQIADVVVFLYRREYYNPSERRGEIDLIFAKNRHGRTGTVTIGCDIAKNHFYERSFYE